MRSGIVSKAGLVTDYTNQHFISAIIDDDLIRRIVGFNNLRGIFPAVHPDTPFILLTLGRHGSAPSFCFGLLRFSDLDAADRQFQLTGAEIAMFNPNTRAIPTFRSREDARLSAKIYRKIPVLLREGPAKTTGGWDIRLRTMFHKSNASKAGHLLAETDILKVDNSRDRWLPVNEGEYGAQFDHRYATFEAGSVRAVTGVERADYNFEPKFELVASAAEYQIILKRWMIEGAPSLIGFRRVSNPGNDRTAICAILPLMPCTYGWILVTSCTASQQALLCANFNSLVFDYLLRNNLSQPSIPQSTFEQIPTLPPSAYTSDDVAFVVPRVLELTYTSWSLQPFARELGHDGPPFRWDDDRRALLRAELNAFYACAYGLARDELRFILDPAEVKGAEYPSETFRVLKAAEMRRFSEYRTARLVLHAYDRLPAERAAAAAAQ